MNIRLTKTDFISYKECPNNVWIKIHEPEIYDQFEVSEFEKSLAVTGNEVEELARGMFPNGFLVERRSENASELTKKLISEKTPIIFQAVFITDKFLAATDVLKWNDEAQKYDLYEIKMSSTEEESEDGKTKKNRKKEEQFEYDLAFQANVCELSGLQLNKKYLVRLNKKYVRKGDLDFSQLFILEDKTEIVDVLKSVALVEMGRAFEDISKTKRLPSPCPCYYKGRSAHCTTFSISNPDVPAYSVHDLNRIGNSKSYLGQLLNENILHISDIPIDDRLKNKKLNQVLVHKNKKPLVNLETIKEELGRLEFPLYFLDYETYPTAIPPFNGYRPYQHIVFQYSLHVLRDKNSEPEHYECLILDGDPSQKISESLSTNIGPKGSVISWYKNFENSRNKELAEIRPEYKKFFESVIERTYDLMDIVENQHYVHPDFKGRSSIKKVLPVLVPHLSYENLGVKNGTDAIEAYRKITSGEITGKEVENKKKEMLEYCKVDTLAMVELFKVFNKLVEQTN